MQSIRFDDGIKEYDINGDESRVIRINISDFNLLKRRDEAVKNIDALVRDMKADGSPTPEKLTEYDQRFREQINYIFGSDVCTPAFGSAHCMSVVGGGRMLFEGFLDALLKQVERDIGATQNGFKLRIESIDRAKTDKYIAPTTGKPVPKYAGMTAPNIDIGALSDEEKKALLAQLMS